MSEHTPWDELVDALHGEVPEAVVFGPWGWGGYPRKDDVYVPDEDRGEVLAASVARPYLEEGWSFRGGYRAADSYAVFAWSENYVAFVSEYDGSTRLRVIPRDPSDEVEPYMA